MTDIANEMTDTLAWLGLALTLMAVGFGAVDLTTPGKLRLQVANNLNAAVLVGGKVIAVAIIVAAGIWSAPDELSEGLWRAVVYSALGLVASVVLFLILNAVMPRNLRTLVNEPHFDPLTALAAATEVGLAIVIAAALS